MNDTQRIQRVIRQLVSTTFIDVLVVTITVLFLFLYSWKVGVFTLLTIPFYFLVIRKNNSKIVYLQREVMQSYANVESNYINTFQGVTDIKINNKQALFSQINNFVFALSQEKLLQLGKVDIKISWISGAISVLFLIGVLLYTSIEVLEGGLLLGELMAIFSMVSTLLPSVLNLALISIPINEAKVAFSRMYHLVKIAPEEEKGKEIKEIISIELKNISFRFVGGKTILSNTSLQGKRGEIIALVGENGCGKSTLANLLLQFYTPESGEIIINQQHLLNSISIESYRRLVAYIPQEIALFNGNVLDNILLGEKISTSEVYSFLKEYGFDFYFDLLPQGIATQLGEKGVNISGGQKQLIAFARALLKKPQLLILDEATSAMDRSTESFVLSVLHKLKTSMLVFFISHRLHSLSRIADCIYVLEDGRVGHFGNHQHLMQTKNFYSDFFLEEDSRNNA